MFFDVTFSKILYSISYKNNFGLLYLHCRQANIWYRNNERK